MQIISLGDNMHEISNPIFWEKYEIATMQCLLGTPVRTKP